MVRKLRSEHSAAVARLGVNTHRELRRAFDTSSYRRALLIDDALAGLGGVTGSAMARAGSVWLAITQDATRHPHLICRLARAALDDIFAVKRELRTFILPADKTSFRFAKLLGFETLRNSGIDESEGDFVPMIIRVQPKIPYIPPAAEPAVWH